MTLYYNKKFSHNLALALLLLLFLFLILKGELFKKKKFKCIVDIEVLIKFLLGTKSLYFLLELRSGKTPTNESLDVIEAKLFGKCIEHIVHKRVLLVLLDMLTQLSPKFL